MKRRKIRTKKGVNNLNFLLCLLVVSIICFSCNNREAYLHFKDIREAQWSKNDTLFFEIDSTSIEPNMIYNISIEIVNNAAYPYRNIWLYMWDNFIDSTYEANEKQYMIADEYGKWYGSGFGASYQTSLIYKQSVQFKEKRNHTLKLIQGMRDEPLEGIEKIGLKVESASK